MKPRAIKVHIQELVLEGVPPGDRRHIGDQVRSELARLLSEKGMPPGLRKAGNRESIDAGTVRLSSGRPKRTQLGAQVAQAIYRGLK